MKEDAKIILLSNEEYAEYQRIYGNKVHWPDSEEARLVVDLVRATIKVRKNLTK